MVTIQQEGLETEFSSELGTSGTLLGPCSAEMICSSYVDALHPANIVHRHAG